MNLSSFECDGLPSHPVHDELSEEKGKFMEISDVFLHSFFVDILIDGKLTC